MRRAALLPALIALLCAGCGGGHPKPSSALDDAVGYFSKDAPFVAAVETDPNGPQIRQAMSLLGRFPGASVLGFRLENFTRIRFVDWQRDIKPQLGAPLVIGLARPAAGSGLGTVTLVAMQVKHPLRVKQILLRQPNVRGRGKSSGVRIYEDPIDKRYEAVDGNVLVAGTDRDILAAALALRRTDNRMRAADFVRDLKGLPAGGLVRVSAAPSQLIGVDPRLRPALDVKWLSSLRRLGAVVKAVPTGVTLDFHLATDSGSLRDADLPLAPHGAPVPLIGKRDEIQVGVRQPGRLVRLAMDVLRKVAPRRLARFRSLEPRGVDLEQQLPHHLAGLAVAAFNPVTRAFAGRVTLRDARDVKAALGALGPALPGLAGLFGLKGLGLATPEQGESFYALAKPNGGTAVFGVVGNALVAASEPQRAAGLASEATHVTPGARGTAVVTMNARELVGELLARKLSGPAALFAPLVASALRDFTGGLAIDRGGLAGHFKLTIVR